MHLTTDIKNRTRTRRGFTLAEVLAVVGIVAVLLVLLVPNLVRVHKETRQKELDAKAEILYVAAQNELIKLRAEGNAAKYATNSNFLPLSPSDEDPEAAAGRELVYLTSSQTDNASANLAELAALLSGAADGTLANGYWVVEYDRGNGTVYAVFYSESEDIGQEYVRAPGKFNGLRRRSDRIDAGAEVGYYNGVREDDSASGAGSIFTLRPTVTVRNGERLSVYLQCRAQSKDDQLSFKLTIRDEFGHVCVLNSADGSLPALSQSGTSFYYDLTLDDLSLPWERFNVLFGEGSGRPASQQLVPGSKLTLVLEVHSPDKLVEDGSYGPVAVNSLFGDETDSAAGRAVIECGRHLQNLDESSGVASMIRTAEQKYDVDLKNNTGAGSWAGLYGESYFNGGVSGLPNFKPIRNDALEEFDGGGNRIAGLRVSAAGDAGLFERFSGGTLRRIRLTDCVVSGVNVGALAGVLDSDGARITDCRVYLERADIIGKNASTPWIEGSRTAGGLVGAVSGPLDVENSFAATVITAGESGAVSMAGGLVGAVNNGALDLQRSYADCYLKARQTGGLVGGGAVASIRDCYSAGFQDGAKAAGFVPDTVGRMQNAYTVCFLAERDGAQTWSAAKSASQSTSHVYCLSVGNTTGAPAAEIGTTDSAALQAFLGGAFQTDTGDTLAYNLRDQGLTTYPYPRLTAARHYGDWQATFQVGALVYYEKYAHADRTYGFYGANVRSTLTELGEVVGDGYGFVFRADGSPIPSTITVTPENGSAFHLSTTSRLTVVDPDNGARFYIIPLPKNRMNAEPTSQTAAKYYQKISVSATDGEPDVYAFNPHFAKTVIMMQNVYADVPAVEEVLIRTPRHLYNLSLYYDEYYAAVTSAATFRQERNIRYSSYEWAGFSAQSANVTGQLPIGRSGSSPFAATYDGGSYTITDVSFITTDGDYVGMFGYNTGTLKNVVLVTDYEPSDSAHYYVQRTRDMKPNVPVYMGVLAGWNASNVDNCAVAGYYVAGSDGTLHAYENCTLYVGGLVGGNAGVITNSAADCPEIQLSSIFADASMGGFIGRNLQNGSIRNCYALGFLRVTDSRGGSVHIAGFAGSNEGQLNNCYSAVALEASGDTAVAHGFAPTGGLVTECFYLNNGTYDFVGALRSFTTPVKDTDGKPLTSGEPLFYGDLQNKRGGSAAAAKNTLNHPNTGDRNTAYPFRAVVRGRAGALVHYGDWPTMPQIGAFGLFYWEKEIGGANDGYHITYLGVSDSGASVAGSSLCVAHDDGGQIAEFGYGYYQRDGHTVQVGSVTGLAWSGAKKCNAAAAEAFRSQMRGYTFYPFRTRVASDADYIYLNNGENVAGALTLSDGALSRRFTLTPFFANAMQCGGAVSFLTADGRTIDFSAAPGESGNVFEVRSAEQLQYINWNSQTHDCSTLVKEANRTHFPFLQYATNLAVGVQKKADVLNVRPVRYWMQSHDISGDGFAGYTPIAGMGTSSPTMSGEYENFLYAWFGGSYDGQSYKVKNLDVVSPSYSVGLFGVTLGADLKNVIMFSDCDARVERRTAGTEYENLDGAYNIGGLVGVAYEYKSTSIDNKLENCAVAGYLVVDSSTNRQGAGTANVGGLVGLANMNISRCSAVTDIRIACTHEHGHMAWGSYLRVGGLAGSAGAPRANGETAAQSVLSVSDCYTGGSVIIDPVTLNEKPTSYESDGYANRDKNNIGRSVNIFVSGMIGGSYALNMCNITGFKTSRPDGTANINNCYTYLQLPNLEGSVRAVSLFANQGDRYGQQTNEGTVITLNNCYYLESIKEGIGHPDREDPTTWPEYFFRASKTFCPQITRTPTAAEWALLRKPEENCTAAEKTERRALIDHFKELVISDEEFEAMLQGDLTYLTKYLHTQGATATKAAYDALFSPNGTYNTDLANRYYKTRGTAAQPVSYDTLHAPEMADALGSDWGWVTVKEPNGALIDGKYSFSSLDSQEGKNYPFPTVVRQTDYAYGEEVNVHYGRWPVNGYVWADGRESMDIFADMKPSGFAEKTFWLNYAKNAGPIAEGAAFKLEPAGLAEIVACTPDAENSRYEVTVCARGIGAVRVTELNTDASFSLNITGELRIESDPGELDLFHGASQTVRCTAKSDLQTVSDESERFDYTDRGVWELTSPDEDLLKTEAIPETTAAWIVTGQEPDHRALTVRYTYDYHGVNISKTAFVSARTYGYIGLLSADTDAQGKNIAVSSKRHAGTAAAPIEASVYGGTPALPVPAQFALFATNADGDLESFRIDRVSVGTGALSWNVYPTADAGAPFEVEFYTDGGEPEIEPEADRVFRYWCAALRYTGAGDAPSAAVTVELTDPNGSGRYVFTVPISAVPRYTVRFNGGAGADGAMRGVGAPGDSLVLPPCEFTKTGYTFIGWLCGGTLLQPGDTLAPVNADMTVTAQWTANTYTVHFNPNGGTGVMADLQLVYDAPAAALPANAFGSPSAMKNFVGWSTEPDGLGDRYADGEAVRNLKTEGELTLYAQWLQNVRLTLVGSGSSEQFLPAEGSDRVFDDPAALPGYWTRAGWTLDGWYTAASMDGVRVLDENGVIAADVDGITADGKFLLTADRTLYARWSRSVRLPVDRLDSGAADGDAAGTYLIVSASAAGTRKLVLLPAALGDKKAVASADVTVSSGTYYDASGALHADAAYIAGEVPEKAVWTATYIVPTVNGRAQFAYPRYSLHQNAGLQPYYLRENGGDLVITPNLTYKYGSVYDYNDRNAWTYGTYRPGQLAAEWGIGNGGRAVYWNGSAWKSAASNVCSLFKAEAEDIYCFGWIEAEP